ncbi:fucolectin-3-like [Bolinopsis microptera]|uniref:fucolectin-3-like n=1 Tax=Bolinopsis microptera TaxID=2820187 RepID=UPI003079D0CC
MARFFFITLAMICVLGANGFFTQKSTWERMQASLEAQTNRRKSEEINPVLDMFDRIPLYDAKQSSTYKDGVASRAIDGNRDGQYHSGLSCTHTDDNEDNVSWEAKMKSGSAQVAYVVISNRLDGYYNRINGVKVFVDDQFCGAVEYLMGVENYAVKCPPNTVGSVVRITGRNQVPLTLCEVRVLGNDSVCKCNSDE